MSLEYIPVAYPPRSLGKKNLSSTLRRQIITGNSFAIYRMGFQKMLGDHNQDSEKLSYLLMITQLSLALGCKQDLVHTA